MMNQPPRRPPPPPCPQCHGQRIWAEVYVSEGLFRMVYAHGKPGGVFSSPKMVDVGTVICLNSGYTAFYAKDVLKMRADFQHHPEWFDL